MALLYPQQPWFPGGDSLRRAAPVSASSTSLGATEQFGAGTEPRGRWKLERDALMSGMLGIETRQNAGLCGKTIGKP